MQVQCQVCGLLRHKKGPYNSRILGTNSKNASGKVGRNSGGEEIGLGQGKVSHFLCGKSFFQEMPRLVVNGRVYNGGRPGHPPRRACTHAARRLFDPQPERSARSWMDPPLSVSVPYPMLRFVRYPGAEEEICYPGAEEEICFVRRRRYALCGGDMLCAEAVQRQYLGAEGMMPRWWVCALLRNVGARNLDVNN